MKKKRAIAKFKAAAREARELWSEAEKLQGKGVDDDRFIQWRKDTRTLLEDVFGSELHELDEFKAIRYSLRMQPDAPDEERQRRYVDGLKRAEGFLQNKVSEIRADRPDDPVVFPTKRFVVIVGYVITVAAAIVTIIVHKTPIIAAITAKVEYVQRFFTR